MIDMDALRELIRAEVAAQVSPVADAQVLLTVPEAARLLGMARTTAYQRIQEGDLRAVKDGSQYKVPRAAVDEYADRLRAARGQASKRRKTQVKTRSQLPPSDPASW